MLSGMVSASLYPRAAQTNARPMPVLPLVGSRMIVSGLMRPAFSGRVDHGHPDPVLDAVGGAVELELGHHLPRRALGQAPDPHQRGIADQLRDVVGDFHETSS